MKTQVLKKFAMGRFSKDSLLGGLALSVFMSFSFVTLGFGEEDLKDYWEKVGLEFEILEQRLSNSHCYSSQENFMGCSSALRNIIEFTSNGQMSLVPKGWHQKYSETSKVKHDLGSILIISWNPSYREADTSGKDWLDGKGIRKDRWLAWEEIYKRGINPQLTKTIHFGHLTKWVKDKFVSSHKNISYVTGRAFNAYLRAVADPHTYLMPIKYVYKSASSTEERTSGIGITLSRRGSHYAVIRLVENTPAVLAGIRLKDAIHKVNSTTISSLTLKEVNRLLEGPSGTTVKLSLVREQGTPGVGVVKEISVVREQFVKKNVTEKLLRGKKRKTGYIKIETFESDLTCQEVGASINKLQTLGAKGFILDLRNNPGGSVDQAVCVAGLIVGAGTDIVAIQALGDPSPTNRSTSTRTEKKPFDYLSQTSLPSQPLKPGVPVSVLINAGSASASEIVAGAIQDYQRGWIVGERSYGKGTVQMPVILPDDLNEYYGRLYLFKTVARFYLPSGRTNQIEGIKPDFEVFSSPQPTDEEKAAEREEDSYANALPAEGKSWQQPRPGVSKVIQSCLKQSGSAVKTYQQTRQQVIPGDFQLNFAEDVIACHNT